MDVLYIRGSETKKTKLAFKDALYDIGWRLQNEQEETKEEAKQEEGADERAELLAKAESLGLNIHHRTGIDKIKALIAEAKGE